MHTNRLAREKSPYLLQHQHNPVDWYAWGEEAFAQARLEDKPIFLSVGYSTCHWCHVMERESFESEEVAAVLNRYFIPVKVDREERPDVDRIYMTFVQAFSGGGGWPMSVWLTPELKPFFGGTYFPPDNRYGRPGFKYLLEQIGETWTRERAKIETSGAQIIEQLRAHTGASAPSSIGLDDKALESGYFQFRRVFDPRLGGFGGAPKFPRPVVHNYLLRYARHFGVEEASEMVLLTLREMAKGGMNDQLGGGFHRYSVDDRWFVPHFEKMLYDQAQLAVSYVEGYQSSGDTSLADVARDIFEYVLRDMRAPSGGFYSAEDADSVIDPAEPGRKGEGAFYVWTRAEIDMLLGSPAAGWFCHRYGVERDGNVFEDPHHEFTGKNILFESRSIAETARKFGVGEDEVRLALIGAKAKLMAARDKRVRPHLDDKILTAWNGLMISAFAKGWRALGEPRYREAAVAAAEFVLANLWDGKRLLRRYRDGEAAIPGFLDDYAFFGQAMLDLYEATFEVRYLEWSVRLAGEMIALFQDPAHGGFYSTEAGDENLILRLKEDYDGAEPSGNSVAACLLLRLAHITGSETLRASAEGTLAVMADRLKQIPSSVPQLLVALLESRIPARQVVLAGPAAEEFASVMAKRFLPFHLLLCQRDGLERLAPAVKGMAAVDGKTAAYVCENFACRLPETDRAAFEALLQ